MLLCDYFLWWKYEHLYILQHRIFDRIYYFLTHWYNLLWLMLWHEMTWHRIIVFILQLTILVLSFVYCGSPRFTIIIISGQTSECPGSSWDRTGVQCWESWVLSQLSLQSLLYNLQIGWRDQIKSKLSHQQLRTFYNLFSPGSHHFIPSFIALHCIAVTE